MTDSKPKLRTDGGVDRSGAQCYSSRCTDRPTHRVRWEGGDRWYGICETCADDIPITRGQVVEGLTPETITSHPVVTDGGTSRNPYSYLIEAECPLCGAQNQIVEETGEPVDLMQDVRITQRCCGLCGRELSEHGVEWNLHAEHEIERVTPTQEREA